MASPMPTENPEWGFWGTWNLWYTHEEEGEWKPEVDTAAAWEVASRALAGGPRKRNWQRVRDSLDSVDGRHCAEHALGLLQDGMGLYDAIATAVGYRWGQSYKHYEEQREAQMLVGARAGYW